MVGQSGDIAGSAVTKSRTLYAGQFPASLVFSRVPWFSAPPRPGTTGLELRCALHLLMSYS